MINLNTIKPKSFSMLALILMLILLHLAVWFDFGSLISKSLFLAHFGFFLIWQPIWQQNKKFTVMNTSVFIALIFLLVYWLNLWLIVVWLIMLVGFIGGIFKQGRSEIFVYMFCLFYLISEILIGCNTQIFSIQLNPLEDKIFSYGMIYAPLILLFFNIEIPDRRIAVDLLRAISSALLISMLTLGSLLLMYHNGTGYFDALIQSILAISLCLLLISWLLSPKLGFSGLSQLWYQSLLNIGTPFESWLNNLYSINQKIKSPDLFIETAMNELTSVSWISGIKWQITDLKNESGTESKFFVPVKINQLETTIYTHILAGGALILHCRLLIQLIENMYTAKVQEDKLAQQTQLKNIHETGARITHDIKNLLQSLNTMTAAYETESVSDERKQQLITKQIPHISQRLQLALNKLETPDIKQEILVNINDWFDMFKDRTELENIHIESSIEYQQTIPQNMFDSVVDNLLDNCRYKQQLDPEVSITIKVYSKPSNCSIHVADSGEAIPISIREKLFKQAVPSSAGLGIGLYQAAKQAESHGYELSLLSNVNGWVEFVLAKKPTN